MVEADAARPGELRQRLVVLANMLLPGLYAWLTTVAYPATYRGAPFFSRVTALLALVVLVAGPIVALERPRAGRAVGLIAFVALCVLTWLQLGPFISVQRIEPVRAGLGAVGWALFALGWGALRRTDWIPEEDPHAIAGDPLPRRGALPRGALAVLLAGLAVSVVPLYFAWGVARPRHALLAQAVALACALAVINATATVAVEHGSWRPKLPAQRRLNAAARPLALVVLLLGFGLMWKLLF